MVLWSSENYLPLNGSQTCQPLREMWKWSLFTSDFASSITSFSIKVINFDQNLVSCFSTEQIKTLINGHHKNIPLKPHSDWIYFSREGVVILLIVQWFLTRPVTSLYFPHEELPVSTLFYIYVCVSVFMCVCIYTVYVLFLKNFVQYHLHWSKPCHFTIIGGVGYLILCINKTITTT